MRKQPPNHFKFQRGAILAFSLVMLLLLTLAGVSMIQQNKQQLAMANNARQITQKFSNAEAILANEKSSINTDPAHYDLTGAAINDHNHECVPISPPTYTSNYLQHILLSGLVSTDSTSTVTILSASCMSSTGIFTTCTSYDVSTSKLTCYPKSAVAAGTDCTGLTIDAIAALFSNSLDVCYQTYDPQCNGPCPTTSNINCPSEVYKIDVIAKDTNGSTHEITSDHVVGCGP